MNKTEKVSIVDFLGALFLVAGTTIGAGMLALPVSTCLDGFIPAIVVMAICWIFMTITALLILEITLWMEEGAHIITLSEQILGPFGKAVAWVVYLFIGYASIVAYIAGGGAQVGFAVWNFSGIDIPRWFGCVSFAIVFGLVIYLGKTIIGRVNTVLFIGLVIAYIALISFGGSGIKPEFLMYQKWSVKGGLMMIPLLLTTFSFPGIVPSIVPYLKRNVPLLRIAIIGGTTITFLVYVVWQALVLGTIPLEGPYGLMEALANGEPATQGMRFAVDNPLVSVAAEFFSFFAMVTSFLGMSWTMFDFLADGLKINPHGKGKMFLSLLIVVPSIFFAVIYPRAFIVALETSGGFGDAILAGVLPVLMIWAGRYYQKRSGPYTAWVGKPALVFLLTFSITIIIITFFKIL